MSTTAALARRVDHVIIETADEAALFELFTGTLGLPIAWPVAQWGRYHEGGASVGSCNIGCNHFRDPESDPAPTLRRVALEPAIPIDEAVERLDRRDLLLTPPIVSGEIDVPNVEPYAPWQQGWTVLQLRTGLDPSPFVCAYDHDVAARVQAQQAQLDAAGGGPLGVTGVREVVVHVDSVDEAVDAWRSLFELPIDSQPPDLVTLSTGPSLRFVRGSAPPALVLGVRSMAAATDALASLGIGYELDEELRLAPADALGLDLRLVV